MRIKAARIYTRAAATHITRAPHCPRRLVIRSLPRVYVSYVCARAFGRRRREVSWTFFAPVRARQHLPTISSSHPSTLRPFHILNFGSRQREKITKTSARRPNAIPPSYYTKRAYISLLRAHTYKSTSRIRDAEMRSSKISIETLYGFRSAFSLRFDHSAEFFLTFWVQATRISRTRFLENFQIFFLQRT